MIDRTITLGSKDAAFASDTDQIEPSVADQVVTLAAVTDSTSFSGYDQPTWGSEDEWTPLSRETTSLPSSSDRDSQSGDGEADRQGANGSFATEPVSEVDRLSAARGELLVRKYRDGGLQPEQRARLRLLTERVRKLRPRVTGEVIQGLEQIAADIERSRQEDEEDRRLLDLP